MVKLICPHRGCLAYDFPTVATNAKTTQADVEAHMLSAHNISVHNQNRTRTRTNQNDLWNTHFERTQNAWFAAGTAHRAVLEAKASHGDLPVDDEGEARLSELAAQLGELANVEDDGPEEDEEDAEEAEATESLLSGEFCGFEGGEGGDVYGDGGGDPGGEGGYAVSLRYWQVARGRAEAFLKRDEEMKTLQKKIDGLEKVREGKGKEKEKEQEAVPLRERPSRARLWPAFDQSQRTGPPPGK